MGWYQYTVSVADGRQGIIDANVGKTYSFNDPIVGYSVKGGTFDFTVDKKRVFIDNNGAYYKEGDNTITEIAENITLSRVIAQVVDNGAADSAKEQYYTTLAAAVSAYNTTKDTTDYIRMWSDSDAIVSKI